MVVALFLLRGLFDEEVGEEDGEEDGEGAEEGGGEVGEVAEETVLAEEVRVLLGGASEDAAGEGADKDA